MPLMRSLRVYGDVKNNGGRWQENRLCQGTPSFQDSHQRIQRLHCRCIKHAGAKTRPHVSLFPS